MNRSSYYHAFDDDDRRRSTALRINATRGTLRNTQNPQRNLTRAKTLTRPDRFVAPAPLIAPDEDSQNEKETWFHPWRFFSRVVTFWAPGPLMKLCGIKDAASQQAWREKVSLCFIALCLGGLVGLITMGLNPLLCPQDGGNNPATFLRVGGGEGGFVGIKGWMFNVSESLITNDVNFYQLAQDESGQDISRYFDQANVDFPACQNVQNKRYASANLCANETYTGCLLNLPLNQDSLDQLQLENSTKRAGYDWDQVAKLENYFVLDGNVVNLGPYLANNPNQLPHDTVDQAIRYILNNLDPVGGKDATKLFSSNDDTKNAMECIIERYRAGHIDKITPGCFVSQLILYCSLIVILGLVLARFFMAIIFSWFLSHKLVKPLKNTELKRLTVSPAVMPPGANTTADSRAGTAPWTGAKLQKGPPGGGKKLSKTDKLKNTLSSSSSFMSGFSGSPSPSAEDGGAGGGRSTTPLPADHNGLINMESIGSELFCACLITCYSEGLEGIKTTLDSISGTTYSDARKLIFLVCDGMITGSGETVSTPDICVGLIDPDPRFGNPQPMSYTAIAAGQKQHNQAMVYAGHYTKVNGRRTPVVVVVKCGTPQEANDKKPGNRGKRDSQILLMNFFSTVTYNSPMSPLDYDLFRKVHALMGVTPDFFEVCLMVDADTKIYPSSMNHLVTAFQRDPLIMGACGETRIANKRQSWVTAIQVYEYFISHHMTKAFESVFGGVTCLPGCFSMYRLKARKQNESDWIPLLTQAEVCKQYSQSVVSTLHEKNLLLLGEDRFLTTLLLRTFPNRKMIFVPQARCRTIAPDTFKVLLSQRRRWINSTVHNLMELVRVNDLCGTFCFSMQFVVFMDLFGTAVLPVAICLTYALIVTYALNPPQEFSDAIPLLLLCSVIGLPGVLILLTTRKVIYVCWMLVYLIALPIWNFILPVYSFWCFDDFSWGETRKIDGVAKDKGHGEEDETKFDPKSVPKRQWHDWEKARMKKTKREAKRRQQFERAFGTQAYHNDKNNFPSHPNLLVAGDDMSSVGGDHTSETASLATSEEDRWGGQIGIYADNVPDLIHNPVGLYPAMNTEQMYRHSQLEMELNDGWQEDASARQSPQMMPPTPAAGQYNNSSNNNHLGVHNASPFNGNNTNTYASRHQTMGATSFYSNGSSDHDRSTYMLSERDPLEPPQLPTSPNDDVRSPTPLLTTGGSYFAHVHPPQNQQHLQASSSTRQQHAVSQYSTNSNGQPINTHGVAVSGDPPYTTSAYSSESPDPDGSDVSSNRVHAKSSSIEARHVKKRSGGGANGF